MLLNEQLETLQRLGLRFSDLVTPEFLLAETNLEWWQFVDPPFDLLLEKIHWLDLENNQRYGERLTPCSYLLDLESYDGTNRYSELAEIISEMAGCRRELKILNEEMTTNPKGGIHSAHGWIEYSFKDETFRHEHRNRGDWLSSRTILNITMVIDSLGDGFQFFGNHDDQGISFFYMLESERSAILELLGLIPLRDYFDQLSPIADTA